MRYAILGLLAGCWEAAPPPPPPIMPAHRSPEANVAQMVEAPEPAADQVPLHSEWTGKYVCGQGSTGLRLTIESHPSGEAIATFEFGPIPENPTVPVGAYQLKGRLRMTPDGGLEARFVPDQWLNQPSGYMMVGLTVVSDRARRVLRGTIDDPNCAGVEVRRRS